jgi:hypothetical protein
MRYPVNSQNQVQFQPDTSLKHESLFEFRSSAALCLLTSNAPHTTESYTLQY